MAFTTPDRIRALIGDSGTGFHNAPTVTALANVAASANASFYNRKTELQTLQTFVNAERPTNIALIGQRKIGKTQILFELERRLEKDTDIVSTYIYVEPGAFLNFCELWLFAVLSKTAIAIGVVTSDELLATPGRERMRLLASRLVREFPEMSERLFDLVGREKQDGFETLANCFEFIEYFAEKKNSVTSASSTNSRTCGCFPSRRSKTASVAISCVRAGISSSSPVRWSAF